MRGALPGFLLPGFLLSAFLLAAFLLAALLLLPATAEAKVFLTVDEALALAFPGCEVERQTVFLTAEQLIEARRLAGEGVEIESGLVHPYVAACERGEGGTAYFDSHLVRTLPETLMVVVAADGTVERLEILSFREPEEYIPRDLWYDQLLSRPLDDELNLDRAIRGVTGATLTARATTSAVRRVLAVHAVIAGGGTP